MFAANYSDKIQKSHAVAESYMRTQGIKIVFTCIKANTVGDGEERELVDLLSLSSWCLVIVVWLFLALTWVCLLFVIVVFPDRTHLLFYSLIKCCV